MAMKNVLLVPVIFGVIISSFSCRFFSGRDPDPGDIAGGPCSYDEYRVPARIIVFERLDSSTINVIMKLDSNEWVPPTNDTLDFYMETGRYLTRAEADSLHLEKGKALTYLIQRIRSGSCNPEINTLLTEPME